MATTREARNRILTVSWFAVGTVEVSIEVSVEVEFPKQSKRERLGTISVIWQIAEE